MFPIRDDQPTRHPPVLTVTFIALNVLVFLWQISGTPLERQAKVYAFAAVPYNVANPGSDERAVLVVYRNGTESQVLPAHEIARYGNVRAQAVPPWLSLITSMFLHGGWMHLIGNMLFLWIFGNNIEDACGRARFALFYLLTGLAAAAAHIASDATSLIPTLGASGAISGILGGYLVLYPRAQVLTVVPIFFLIQMVRLPAVLFLVIWFLMQVFNVLGGGSGGVAWYAHIGGFVAGVLLIKLFESGEHRGRGGWDDDKRFRSARAAWGDGWDRY